ncbi:MAG TPA: methyltransferase domain-containing protein [Geobacteraceae bacterium]|nr:methyltransferase domain-containing protein [Geobacteraceae bacterium]
MKKFSNYSEFKALVREAYPLSGIDELTRDSEHGYWLDREMFRWYRLCLACSDFLGDEGGVLLDVGAFPFTALKVVKSLCPGVKLSGVGLWDEEVDRILAADPLLGDGDFSLCNFDPWIVPPKRLAETGSTFSCPDGSVDLVIFTEVIEHLYNPAHVLKEISRVLKPGGRLYLTTNNVSYWFYALRVLKGETNLDRDLSQITVDFEREHPHDWRGHVRFYSIGQLVEMLALAGMKKVLLATTYDTTDMLPSQAGVGKQVRTWVKGLTNRMPLMNRLRGHIEIVVEK